MSDTVLKKSPITEMITFKTLIALSLFQVLRARLLQNPISEWDELFNRIAIFILDCNGEQIRHWSSKFADLCHLFTDQLVSTHFTLKGMLTLGNPHYKEIY